MEGKFLQKKFHGDKLVTSALKQIETSASWTCITVVKKRNNSRQKKAVPVQLKFKFSLNIGQNEWLWLFMTNLEF